MGDTTGKPESYADTLDRLLAALKSGDPQAQRAALKELDGLTFSSAAIVAALEQIALNQEELRPLALAALTSPASRAVYRRGASLDAPKREIILSEIVGWQKSGLLDETRTAVLKGRYGFDLIPTPTPKPAPVPQAAPTPRPEPVQHAPQVQPAPAMVSPAPQAAPAPLPTPLAPPVSPAPQRTFLQAILSETSIKIFLYLGAFFVIASAIILAALVEMTRLPVLGLATLIFGGAALGLRKRLPQPSFTLFIVFSFLLPITASVLRQTLSITGQAADLYWLAVLLIMAGIWTVSTWIYESRLFSLTAFGALTLAFLRVGNLLDAETELYGVLAGLSVLIGLAGVWALKRWKGPKFALGLFLAAQAVQGGALLLTLVVGIMRLFSQDVSANWHFASALTWLLAFGFYALSDVLFPTFFFSWLAAATLIPVPWFVNAALQWEGARTTWLFLAWGVVPSLMSEALQRVESIRKYSLPVLLTSMPSLIIALAFGFNVDALNGFGVAVIVAATYTLLHLLREREWLWTLALLYFITAYFAFFNLPFIENTDVFWGYRMLGLSLLSLLPDLVLKPDFKDALPWRRPLRLFGALFTGVNILLLALFREDPLGNAAIIFGVYAILCAAYAWRYQRPLIGYVSTLTLALATLFALQHFDLDLWMPVLTSLSVLYYLATLALRGGESFAGWRRMLAVSALALGSIVSLVALVTLKLHGGWFIAIVGALFIAEMYLSKRDLFEVGAHLLFPAAAFLLLRDFHVDQAFYFLLTFGLTWLALDLAFSHTFPGKRSFETIVQIVGAVSVLLSTALVLLQGDPAEAAICFGISTIFFLVYAAVQNKAFYGYVPAAYLPLTFYFTLKHFDLDLWVPVLTAVGVLYYAASLALRRDESRADWQRMWMVSALTLGSVISIFALATFKAHSGWFVAIIGGLFIAEMYLSKRSPFEVGAHLLFPAATFLLLRDFHVDQAFYIWLALGLAWLTLDLVFSRTFPDKRDFGYIVKIVGFVSVLLGTALVLMQGDAAEAAICFGISTIFFLIYTVGQGQAIYGYAPALYLPLTVYFTLQHFDIDAWLPSIMGLAVTYFAVGTLLRARADWGRMLRRSGLIVGAALSLGAFVALKETGGWYILVIGLLFAAEMYLSRDSRFEIGLPILFNLGATLLLRDFDVHEIAYFLLAYSLTWLLTDLLAHLTFAQPRLLEIPVRVIGGLLTAGTYGYLLLNSTDAPLPAAVSFGMYSLVAVGFILAYRQPWLVYTLTGTLPLFVAYFFRIYGITQWIHPAAMLAAGYYVAGYILRRSGQSPRWDTAWLTSGLGLGVILSAAAVLLGGLDAAIPVAIAATLWAVEAFARRNVWLGFPANALYLLAYFIVLFELKVDEPQFFSMGAALLGLIQHYFLTRATSKTATFITGMVSQLILLGATYIQMFNTQELVYFAMLFFQGLVVLFYGIVIRSRSLVITPILFVVLGVVTVVYSTLQGISTILIVGCTGIFMILLGTLAVIQRERLMRISERFSDWNA